MSLSGKKFTDLSSGRILEIRDTFEDIAVATDGTKLSVRRLMDRNYFDEYVDPKSFTTNESFLNSFASMIKNIPTESLPQEGVDVNNISGSTSIRPAIEESAILPYDPEEEKMELLRKAQTMYPTASEDLRRQMESLSKIIGDDEDLPVIQQHTLRPIESQEHIQRVEVNRNDDIQRVEVNRDVESYFQEDKKSQVEDPIIAMFKNVKRNNEFKISLDIVNKIPRNDFIEMMEDSYNTSIIEFLANEFTNELLKDPAIIKNKIISEIKRIVYGEPIAKKPIKTPVKKQTKTNTSIKKTSRVKKNLESNDTSLGG